MIKFMYEINEKLIRDKKYTLAKINYRLVRFILNLIVPIYYKYNKVDKLGVTKVKREKKIIVSLTSFPERIDKIWLTLESVMRQTLKADEIILYLANTQFENINDLPTKIIEMQKRGLKIKFCKDMRSHKKYLYAMQEYPDDIIITVDDDIFYREDMIEELYNKYKKSKGCIIAYRCHRILLNKDGDIDNYSKWDYCSKGYYKAAYDLCATSGGGTLFPPNCLDKRCFNEDNIKKLCPTADDLWLKVHSLLKNTKTVKVNPYFTEMISIYGTNKTGLANLNVLENENDRQIKKIIKFYNIDIKNFIVSED